MPWARLHGIKDYLDMVEILDGFPSVRLTFNVVPSLIDQIEDYGSNVKDRYLDFSRKKASELTDGEKDFIITNFFMCNRENMVKPYPRYVDLLSKRGELITPEGLPEVRKRFLVQDILDLQVWFNLAWFDPSLMQKFQELGALVKKGSYFTESEKKIVLDKQMEILRQIVPKYRQMQQKGQIEVSVSPYYHPILPLLCDTDVARVSDPRLTLPVNTFRHPEDARWHIDRAVEHYRARFGIQPNGMWPSEGSVSEEILPLVAGAGIKWIATDEDILFQSLARSRDARLLYRPYRLQRNGVDLSVVFRDRMLSDLIGFTYSRLPAKDAVDDFMKHLTNINSSLSRTGGDILVTVALDGENAWEYYINDGRDFLLNLYGRLAGTPWIKTVTVNEFLDEHPPAENIQRLFAGSWINHNFNVWIGHREKNLSWDALYKTRLSLSRIISYQDAEKRGDNKLLTAWRCIYVAEGSDWNWWYGGDHSSANDEEFDRLYRKHLSNVFELTGEKVPDYLLMPIKAKEIVVATAPLGLMKPHIDGLDTSYYEWLAAGYLDFERLGTAMHQINQVVRRIYYGFDLVTLYLRVDFAQVSPDTRGLAVNFIFEPVQRKLEVEFIGDGKNLTAKLFSKDPSDKWVAIKQFSGAAFKKILEIAVPFKDLGAGGNDTIGLLASVERNRLFLEVVPHRGPLSITLPTPDYELEHWSV
jgi:alpha-amylase/alpha-mannosidase (GH57 family)